MGFGQEKNIQTLWLWNRMLTDNLIKSTEFFYMNAQHELLKYISQHSDMVDEMKTEAMELCVTACEKFASNNEVSFR